MSNPITPELRAYLRDDYDQPQHDETHYYVNKLLDALEAAEAWAVSVQSTVSLLCPDIGMEIRADANQICCSLREAAGRWRIRAEKTEELYEAMPIRAADAETRAAEAERQAERAKIAVSELARKLAIQTRQWKSPNPKDFSKEYWEAWAYRYAEKQIRRKEKRAAQEEKTT